MPIFISYNHQDKKFAHSLAANLVRVRHSVWIDTWEMAAGESLIEKIQGAVGEADALIAIISSSSVESEWCKRELNSAIMRELQEKRVLIIPCIVDECEIPVFLREKLYCDFRSNRDEAFELLDNSLRKISNPTSSRIEQDKYHTDWSVSWGDINGKNAVDWVFLEIGENSPYSVLMWCRLLFMGEKANEIFKKHLEAETQILYASDFFERFLREVKGGEFRVMIEGVIPKDESFKITGRDNENALLNINIRRLGTDTGMDILYNADNVIRNAIHHTRNVLRSP